MQLAGVDIEQLRNGHRRHLAKAITLVESRLDKHREQAQALLQAILPATGNSIRIGISGTPGVGKSTFIEALGLQLLAQGKQLAVLAVDPSSPRSGGSILGDKTRMEQLARQANAYIRPSPSAGELGGVAQQTRETMLLCEAAGFDVIIVETVGVGQSEFEVADMVDLFLVLMQPNAGDELQGIKKGIVELADLIVINKADGETEALARQAQRHYRNALQLLTGTAQVLCCSALHNQGIEACWQAIEEHIQQQNHSGVFVAKRAQQHRAWMEKLFMQLLKQQLQEQHGFIEHKAHLQNEVVAGRMTALQAAQELLTLSRHCEHENSCENDKD